MALKLRMRQGQISQNRLAVQAEVQPQHLSKWMQGKVCPSVQTRFRLWHAVRAIEREEGR